MTTMAEAAVDASSRAFTFGPPERALFGWYHPPRATPRDVAVLLCSPVGWEAQTMHRTYRTLAEQLSEAGFATLRFDLDGTGDSAGTDEDPERVAAWLQSIQHAATQLRLLSGLDQLSLFGIHLGATLAAEFAATEGGVATAVLWAPVLRGKLLAREIRTYGALNGGGLPGGDQDAAGFFYRADTLDALSKMDLVKLPPAARRVLLLRQSENSGEDVLAAAWRERGADVTCEFLAGYDDLMQESRLSQTPDQLIDHVVGWHCSQHPVQGGSMAKALPPSVSGVREPLLNEELCFFGPGAQFFGILTRATNGDRDRPTVVFLNTSDDHRIGPHRMYVPLSRELGRLGLTSFRFDPTGIGDHRGPRVDDPAQCYADGRLLDTTVALDFLESQGFGNRFILVGLCSGAYVAFHIALNDDRVVGTVMINPLTFTWKPGDSLDVKIRESFRSPSYKRAIRQFMTWTGQAKMIDTGRTLRKYLRVRAVQIADRVLPSRLSNEFRVDRGLKALLARGARVLLIFDDVDEHFDVFNGHVGKDGGYLRRDPRFQFELLKGADHTFTRIRDRRTLFTLLLDYLTH